MIAPTVFLSGILCDQELWAAQMDALSDITECIFIDPEGETISDMAVSVLHQAPDRFALCASSMGGYIAMQIVGSAPNRLDHLILSNTSARADHPKQREFRLSTIEELKTGEFDRIVDRLLPALVSPTRRSDKGLMQSIYEMMHRVGAEKTLRQQLATLARPDFRLDLSDVAIKTLVLSSQHDRVTPPEHGQEIASLIPNASHFLLEDSGHLSPMDAREQVTKSLRDWLQVGRVG